jgi:hypothetical protein
VTLLATLLLATTGCDKKTEGTAPASSAAPATTTQAAKPAGKPAETICSRIAKLDDEPMSAADQKDCLDTFNELATASPAAVAKLSTCLQAAKDSDGAEKCMDQMDKDLDGKPAKVPTKKKK